MDKKNSRPTNIVGDRGILLDPEFVVTTSLNHNLNNSLKTCFEINPWDSIVIGFVAKARIPA